MVWQDAHYRVFPKRGGRNVSPRGRTDDGGGKYEVCHYVDREIADIVLEAYVKTAIPICGDFRLDRFRSESRKIFDDIFSR